MLEHVFCERILGIASPWHITKSKQDIEQKRVDIWIGKKGHWFKQPLGAMTSAEDRVWQHLGFGGFRTYIHVAMKESDMQDADYLWLGKKDMPFSHALTKRVLEMLGERMGYSAVCSLLNVDLQDVWRLKHTLDTGVPETGVSDYRIKLDKGRQQTKSELAEPLTEIPPVDDPVWHQVISSETEVDIRQLGLKLLISRVRNQYVNAGSDEIRTLRKSELRKYFIRHEHSLQHELRQIMPL